MNRAQLLVIADDLTGAAEIAALGHLRGLRTAVLLDAGSEIPAGTDLLVIDSNTRQDPPALAAEKVRSLLAGLPLAWRALVFKKVDSVLRGPVAAELEALASALGRHTVLLCPCNPSRGRCIVRGRYQIDGVPLHLTSFASDPHYPATTDEVLALLNSTRLARLAHDAGEASTTTLPPALHLGSASSPSEIHAWAQRIEDTLLPAGGADFFDAYLTRLGLPPAVLPTGAATAGPHLLLSGSLAPAGLSFRRALLDTGTAVFTLPVHTCDRAALDRCIVGITSELQRSGRAVAATSDQPLASQADPAWLETCFSLTAVETEARHGFRHLLAEGGATAALAAAALSWSSFTVAGVWAGGVVSLRPDKAPSCLFTMKPGSYPWPAQIRRLLSPESEPLS